MTDEEIRQLAHKYYRPKDRINDNWNPIYIDECKKINRRVIEKSLIEKYNVSRKINSKIKKSTLFPGMGKT